MSSKITEENLFENTLIDHFKHNIKHNTPQLKGKVEDFVAKLIKNFGYDYGKFSPYITGNYAVFMEHGTWFETLRKYKSGKGKIPDTVKNYISLMDSEKISDLTNISKIYNLKKKDTISQKLKFSQLITDIQLPEPSKEYMAISTRQKNSFVNTRDYAGSDFSINMIEEVNLPVFKYMEAWQKSIDLIREGLFFDANTGKDYFEGLVDENYLIENPYCNTIWVALLDSKGVDLRGIITLFGVMPINTPLKSLIGDRGSPKIATYSLNFKFMDMQYVFIDGWNKLVDSNNSAKNNDVTLAKKFSTFLNLKQSKPQQGGK